jgi:putative two-component system hydrogenase maturation factor HypX/HoxX
MKQADRAIDWQRDDSATVLRKINAADGFPGVADSLFGSPATFSMPGPEVGAGGTAGEVIARRETALLRRTVDGAVWIGHVKRPDGIKLPPRWLLPPSRRCCRSQARRLVARRSRELAGHRL